MWQDYAEVKPKRIIIQIEDDDDDDDDDDGGEKYVERGVLSDKTRATGVETLQRNNEDSRSSACAGLDVERKVDEKAGAATALSGPAYKVRKVLHVNEEPFNFDSTPTCTLCVFQAIGKTDVGRC